MFTGAMSAVFYIGTALLETIISVGITYNFAKVDSTKNQQLVDEQIKTEKMYQEQMLSADSETAEDKQIKTNFQALLHESNTF
jgi:hypothetical protein